MIKAIHPIGLHFPGQEPFIFGAHHHDFYPAGNKNFGLDPHHFAGRQMGSDFEAKNGFRLYHGAEIPGFPVHPHRGFETVTIVRQGFADHADSMGAAGRFGEGDVQWMTAGEGVQHSEMFPLLNQDKENTLELFQLWLNLPKKSKMVAPDYKMLWSEKIPKLPIKNGEVTLYHGQYQDTVYRDAPSNSWASEADSKLTILIATLKTGGEFHYPAVSGVNRSLYFFSGDKSIKINGQEVKPHHAVFVESQHELNIEALGDCEILLLEARPINEPTVQYGPFVMNTREEISQTIQDYQRTQFGGWPWDSSGPVHGPGLKRFAKYPDGRVENP